MLATMTPTLLLVGLLAATSADPAGPSHLAVPPAARSAPQADRPAAADARRLEREARAAIADAATSPETLLGLARAAQAAGDGRALLELLDAALERAPDHRAILDHVATLVDAVRLELPLPPAPAVWELEEPALLAAIEATFERAAAWPPTARELAVLRLGAAAHPEAVRATAERALVAPRAELRAFAALVLRRAAPGAAVEALIERSLLDPAPDVRRQAALALAWVGDPAVATPAVRALSARRPVLRLHGAEALGWMGYAEAVPPLAATLLDPPPAPAAGRAAPRAPRAFAFFGTQTAYVQDFDVEVAAGSGIADPRVGVLTGGAVLDVRVLGTSSSPARLSDATRASLTRLTGEDPGRDARAWRAWWETTQHNPAAR